jgi:hypothetical protein
MQIGNPQPKGNKIVSDFIKSIEEATKAWAEFNRSIGKFLHRKRFVKLTYVIKKWKL